MRGLLWAAVLLAPALATAAPASSEDGHSPSATKLIRLWLPSAEAQLSIQTTFRLDIHKSTNACGYGNITINGQGLVQDDNGIGSGSITTREDNIVVAHWQFNCVEAGTAKQHQQLEFNLDFIDGKSVAGTKLIVRFRQVSPLEVGHVEWANALDYPRSKPASSIIANDKLDNVLADGLAELRYMELQLAELSEAIAQKRLFLAQAYRARHKDVKFSDCDSLKCLFSTAVTSVKDMALGLYHDVMARPGHGRPHRGPPSCFPPPHGNQTHGNHTHPPPHKLPFCHCLPPPRLPHHGRPGKVPDHDGPPWDGKPRPGDPKHLPPPPGEDDRQGGEMVIQPIFQSAGQKHPFQIATEEPERPPAPPGQAGPPHGDAAHRPRPFDFRKMMEHISVTHVFALLAILSLILFTIHHCCVARLKAAKARLRQRREERRREHVARRQRCREQRAARRAAFKAKLKAKFSALLQSLKDSLSGRNAEDEEKEAVMRRIHADDSDSDTMSTTMEQFRTVVGVVGDLVAAEEGRVHNRANRELLQHAMHAPPSPLSEFPDDISVVESLPAYDEASDESSRVADGLRYTPGSTMYTPSDTSVSGSLDEVLGRKD